MSAPAFHEPWCRTTFLSDTEIMYILVCWTGSGYFPAANRHIPIRISLGFTKFPLYQRDLWCTDLWQLVALFLGFCAEIWYKLSGMWFWWFSSSYQGYPQPNLARIWLCATTTGRCLVHKSVTQEWQVFNDSAQKCVGFSAGSGSAPDPSRIRPVPTEGIHQTLYSRT